MMASCQRTLMLWMFFAFYGANGTRAEKHICPQEETQLSSPKLEPVIKSGDYEELVWTVKDPNKLEAKQHLVHCSKDLICTSYTQIGDFETRIKIGTPVRGMLNVTLTDHDLLTFSCYIQRKHKSPLPYQVNVSSSVNCLSLVAGQDVILNQALGDMPFGETIEDIDWYWIKHDGEKQKIVSCTLAGCFFEDCSGPCPQWWPRLKIDNVTLVLMNVSDEDRGLKLECRMHPKTVGRTVVKTLKIKDVLPLAESFSSTSQSKNSKKPLQTPSQTPLQTPSQTPSQTSSQTSSKMPSQTPSKTPTSSTAWVHGTQSFAGSRILQLTAVFVSLVIALFDIA